MAPKKFVIEQTPKSKFVSYRDIATHGAFWNIAMMGANKVVTLIGQVVLAWILVPQDMGIAGMATAMAGFAMFLGALSVGDVLVQRGHYKEEAGQAFWLSLFLSIITSLLILCLTPIANWLGHPGVSKLIPILAILPIVDCLTPIYMASLKHDLEFKYLAISSLAGGVSYTIFAALLAWMGYGPFSLVVPLIARSVFTWGYMATRAKLPKIEKPDLAVIKKLFKPSITLSFTGFLGSLQMQAPIFFVGLVLDKTATGHFIWGWMVASQAVFLLAGNLRQVLMPVLAKMNHDPDRQLAATWRAIIAITALLTITCGSQALLFRPILNAFFPEKWRAAGPVITFLSLGLISQGAFTCLSAWLNAGGKYMTLMLMTLLSGFMASSLTYAGALTDGVQGASLGCALGLTISLIISLLYFMPKKTLKNNASQILIPLAVSSFLWVLLNSFIHGNSFVLIISVTSTLIFLAVTFIAWSNWNRNLFKELREGFYKLIANKRAQKPVKKTNFKANSPSPNFFIVGAPKAGTTALSEYLKSHPNVFMCSPKEPKYFDFDLFYPISWSKQKYIDLFAKADLKIHKAIGEASVTYLYSKCAIEEILKFNSQAKFVVMLRNPMDLVQSWHSQQIFTGQENILDFAEAWRAEKDRKKGKRIPFSCHEVKMLYYSEIGKLGEQVERLLSKVEKNEVKFIIFDRFTSNTREVYSEVLEFLNIPENNQIAFKKINERKTVKWPWLQQVFFLLFTIGLAVKTRFGIIHKDFGIIQSLTGLNSKRQKENSISSELRKELKNFFRPEVENLSRLLKLDLSSWK